MVNLSLKHIQVRTVLKSMIKLLILAILITGCSALSKKEDHRRVYKREKVAIELFQMGEKFRREKKYNNSFQNYFKAAEIYRSKFDYENESRVLLKIGFVLSKLKNLNGVNNVLLRLDELSPYIKNFQSLKSSLEVRKYIEFKNVKKAIELIKSQVSITTGIKKQYYIALLITTEDFNNQANIDSLISWSNKKTILTKSLNNVSFPEALLFIHKTLAKVGLRDRNQVLFTRSINKCEKIINFFELVEYSNSIRLLKESL